MSNVESEHRYYCEIITSNITNTLCADFDNENAAVNYFLSEHSRQVNRIYQRRIRTVYNAITNNPEKQWTTVPVYVRIN